MEKGSKTTEVQKAGENLKKQTNAGFLVKRALALPLKWATAACARELVR